MQTRNVKVVLVGGISVGKTSISQRYTQNQFDPKSETTLGAAFSEKKHFYSEGNRSVLFQLWDTAGQQKYRAIAKIYYRNCQVALAVYDVTNLESFQAMKHWVNEIKQHGPKDALIVVVGNKIDLLVGINTPTNEVNYQEAQNYASKVGALFKLVSAKDNQGITELFDCIAIKYEAMSSIILPTSEFNLKPNKRRRCC